MQISEHYRDYPQKTLIVVTNNELARIIEAHERTAEEKEELSSTSETPEKQGDGYAAQDDDERKLEQRKALYANLSNRLLDLIKQGGVKELLVCAPEARKNEITDALHADVAGLCGEVIPKNLASLELDQIVRILNEHR